MAHVVKMSLAVFTAVRIGNHSSTARIAFDSTHEWRGDEQKNRASVKDHHRPSGQARCWPFPGREFPVSRGFLACYEPCPSAARLPLNSAARGPWAMVERRRQFTTTRREANRQDPTGKKTPGGAGTQTGHTGHTAARGHTDHTDEPHNHPPKPKDTNSHENRDRLNSRKNSCKPGVDRSPRPTQKRPPPANPTLPPPAPRAPPSACSKAVGEMKILPVH